MSDLSQENVDSSSTEKDQPMEQEQDDKGENTSPELTEAGQGAEASERGGGTRDLDFILDIPLEISVELGRTRILVNDLLQLGQGSVVELTRLSEEPMDIYVNGKLFARGEVVVVNEKFGVRLTDVVSPVERVKRLG
jgi:flagellar motor switch protein FliN/FliY